MAVALWLGQVQFGPSTGRTRGLRILATKNNWIWGGSLAVGGGLAPAR